MIKLRCIGCDKVWEYKGLNKIYATCPDCKRPVKIKEWTIKSEENKK